MNFIKIRVLLKIKGMIFGKSLKYVLEEEEIKHSYYDITSI